MLISDLQDIKSLMPSPVITHVNLQYIYEIRFKFTGMILRFFKR